MKQNRLQLVFNPKILIKYMSLLEEIRTKLAQRNALRAKQISIKNHYEKKLQQEYVFFINLCKNLEQYIQRKNAFKCAQTAYLAKILAQLKFMLKRYRLQQQLLASCKLVQELASPYEAQHSFEATITPEHLLQLEAMTINFYSHQLTHNLQQHGFLDDEHIDFFYNKMQKIMVLPPYHHTNEEINVHPKLATHATILCATLDKTIAHHPLMALPALQHQRRYIQRSAILQLNQITAECPLNFAKIAQQPQVFANTLCPPLIANILEQRALCTTFRANIPTPLKTRP